MKVKNKTMINLLSHIRSGLIYLSDSLGNMYDETNIPIFNEDPYPEGTLDVEQPFDDDDLIDGTDIVFNEKPSSAPTDDDHQEEKEKVQNIDEHELHTTIASESVVSGSEIIETKQKEAHPINADFEKLLEESANMVKYYDGLATQWKEEQQIIVSDMTLKIIENMILSGCDEIKGDKVFDMKRHRVQPYQLVSNGTPIKETLRLGVEWNGKVFVPAIVSV